MDNNSSPKSNDDTVSGNKEDTSYIVAKIHDIERQMLEGDLIPLHVDGQATTMDLFPCLSGTEDGSANVIKSDKLKGMGFGSYANRLNGEPSKEVANFRTLIASAGIGDDVAISMLSFLKVNECFKNSVYGLFFLHKRVMYPAVGNYVKNTWSRFVIIRNVPLILRKWSPSANLSKEDFKSVPVWVKLHDVHITTFTEDGSSVIATKLGTPLKLDTYTASMCRESWGRSSFARAMTDLHVDVELKDTLVVGKLLEVYLLVLSLAVSTGLFKLRPKKANNRQVKPKDTNSDKVSSNNNSGSKFMADVTSLSGTKFVTSNLFDVLMMVEKDIGVAPIDLVNSKGDDVNVENSKEVNLGNEENDSENGRKEDDNEKTSFMASKSYKGIDSSKIGGGTGRKSLYECWKDDYEDNTYDDDDDEEREDLTEKQPAFCDSFDISLC
ncbi:putative reverse transcriptase domain-containing protein, partial [Tanacetum coccineum]